MLFVYGTLRRGHARTHHLLGDARFLGDATIAGILFDLGRYPGVRPSARTDRRVRGELYDLGADADARLAQLDRYEGPQYDRVQVTAALDDGRQVAAWTYVLIDEPPSTARDLPGGEYPRPLATNDGLRRELLALAADDLRVRERLLADGILHDGYHPDMEALHRRNAARLAAVLDEHGWPGATLVGADGADAAWLIVQHAIGEPDLQRRCLRLLEEAAARRDVPAWQPAMLDDRIRMFEGRPQRYGTQLEPDADGRLRPYRIDDPDGVDARRAAVGLEPLADRLATLAPVPPPRDRERYQREYAAWLRRVGWRS